jgi:adenylate cyclase
LNAAGVIEFNPGSGGFRLRPELLFSLPAQARSVEFLLLAFLGSLLCVAIPVLTPIRASLATLAVLVPLAWFGIGNPRAGASFPIEFSFLTIGMVYALHVLASYFRETHSRQRILSVFGQYIPPELACQIGNDPASLSLEGESKRLTVFFCDLQNFSGVAEQLNPKQLTILLNEYFTAMTEILFRHGGTIDKYIGDSIMAFWGAPVAQADHARRAVLSSFEMHSTIAALAETFTRRGWPAPGMGIGINTGLMSVGNMGSKYRVAYTVVGDAVNLASRLESLTRVYQVPTIVSAQTREDCPGIAFRSLDIVQVRGKHNRTLIYEPVCVASEMCDALRAKLERHEQALAPFIDGQYAKAEAGIRALAAAYPDDRLYPALIARIEERRRMG